MPPLPNQRHERYAAGLAAGKTSTQAYADAGYVNNRRNAYVLKTNKDIINRVNELTEKKQDRLILSTQHVIDGLLENIQKSLGRIPVKIGKEGEERAVYVYRGDVANRAIQLAGIQLGMFRERSEIKHTFGFEKLSDAELIQVLEQEAQALLEDHRSGGSNGTEEGES